MGIRNYLSENKGLKKSLEPSKCGLCGGNHRLTALFMCGNCMDGWTNYQGGDAEATRIRGGSATEVSHAHLDMKEPRGSTETNSGPDSLGAKSSKTNMSAGEQRTPAAEASKEGPRSDSNSAYPRSDDPRTHSSTNSSKAHS